MLKLIIAIASVFVLSSLLFIYFVPLGTNIFIASPKSSNFSLEGSSMQFYPNLRFATPEISYKISSDCILQKQNDMEYAMNIVENLTALEFYPVENNEDIAISCKDRNVNAGNGFFVAGEGGPTNITVAGDFNVITHGDIVLIRESKCETPNVGIHELFHVLGFEHSPNRNNIMYNVTDCKQTIGEDMLHLLDELYSVPSNPDLYFEDVSAEMKGRFLNVNMTVFNGGLKDSANAEINIYADGDLVKQVELNELEIGGGRSISLGNVFISKINVNTLEIQISSEFDEINKENNKIKLEIKNN